MISKISYIHHNPVKRGYVDEAKHWRYSSARDYEDIDGLIEVEKFGELRLSYVFLPRMDGNEKCLRYFILGFLL
jgi:hypothetical protein